MPNVGDISLCEGKDFSKIKCYGKHTEFVCARCGMSYFIRQPSFCNAKLTFAFGWINILRLPIEEIMKENPMAAMLAPGFLVEAWISQEQKPVDIIPKEIITFGQWMEIAENFC